MDKPVLRSEDEVIWLVGRPISQLPANRIPTKGDVLRLFFYFKNGPMKKEKHVNFNGAIAEMVLAAVQEEWDKAGIIVQRKDKVKAKILDLYENYRLLQKGKGCKSNEEKEIKFIEQLKNYFDIAHQDAHKNIVTDRLRNQKQRDEDVAFLAALQEQKTVYMASQDKSYKKKVEEKMQRDSSHLVRKAREEKRKICASATVSNAKDQLPDPLHLIPEHAPEDSDSQSEYGDFKCPSYSGDAPESMKLTKKGTVTLELPKNVFKSQAISTMADRLNMSAGQRTAFMAAVITDGGANLDDVTLSKTSTRREAKRIRKEIANDILTSFNAPDNITLHWDGKIVPDDGERLGVLIAGIPDYKEGKLLGIPVISDGTSKTLADVTHSLAVQWKVTTSIVGLVFDTTATNSGRKRGACVQLENMLQKKLFYFACRHHVMEIIIGAVWKEIFGPTSSPDNLDFKDFKKSWDSLSDKSSFKILNIAPRQLKQQKNIVVQFLREKLSTQSETATDCLPRDDYRECAELMLILLGEEPPRGIHWLRPGAYHHARWMSTVLYSAKMYAFGEQLKYSQTKIEKLRRVCMFNALFYVKAWLSTTSAADAPLNDLQLWHDLNMYTKTDAGVAGAAITALDRHLWYLAEEIVPFALFPNLVSESEKRQIARQLLKVRGTEPLETGIPVFPQLNASTRLIHLIGKKSLLMFNLLNIESDWLSLPPAQWETVDDFQKAAMFVFHVKVVNDLSERAMKLITDFADTITKDEDQLQFMLQVVEAHRRKLPGFTKETLKKI